MKQWNLLWISAPGRLICAHRLPKHVSFSLISPNNHARSSVKRKVLKGRLCAHDYTGRMFTRTIVSFPKQRAPLSSRVSISVLMSWLLRFFCKVTGVYPEYLRESFCIQLNRRRQATLRQKVQGRRVLPTGLSLWIVNVKNYQLCQAERRASEDSHSQLRLANV